MRAFSSVLYKTAKQAAGLSSRLSQQQLPVGFFNRAPTATFARLAQSSRSIIVGRRAYSTEPSSSEKEKAAESSTTSKSNSSNTKKQRDHLFPETGPLSPVGIGMFLLTAGGILYYFTIVKDRVRKETAQKSKGEEYGKADIGGPFELIDQNGNIMTDRSLHGKFALVYFGFCHCPDICPDEMDKMGDALEMLERDPKMADVVQPVFITCDPQRDSPDAIKEYLKQFHPKFIGLTGSIDQVRNACKKYRVYFSKPPKVGENQDYLVDHSIFSYFMDPDGAFIDVYGKERTAEFMAKDIERRIKQFTESGRTVKK
ncbi:Cu-binding protein [Coemansia spiralis]|uniref:Cu-binding protein n=1 Tax=Coemansia spiralis TaxID=417178 RepID=A0A9W8FXY9_9FUNG|nr:SCO1/SenC-domain-containing protein [Coemansia spiralis]KAJ2619219.1 Cu-binding protein [Coemansia sp. RSA 1358]KAJ2670455.1 Cu-binding protein [Coemansia spiralis]